MTKQISGYILAASFFCAPAILHAQKDSARQLGPQIGDIAPDFALPGATRYGLLKNPVRLSDFRGQTVVLAFFYQARTKG